MALQQGLIVEMQQRLRQFVVLVTVKATCDTRCQHQCLHRSRLDSPLNLATRSIKIRPPFSKHCATPLHERSIQIAVGGEPGNGEANEGKYRSLVGRKGKGIAERQHPNPERQTDARMSAFGARADIKTHAPKGLLLAISGHTGVGDGSSTCS
uniref:Uncharacterized protein n=1 Tax=uncultured marine microorganism HF4000_005I08 TaxID=455507 RepID=B3T0H7_9ZZZZ|nr:hypothetical protein ALOHA_HF4000005I08ctg1g13 [uncultured marine microorganism HF4000_005I08]